MYPSDSEVLWLDERRDKTRASEPTEMLFVREIRASEMREPNS